jgi:hypothetical protein
MSRPPAPRLALLLVALLALVAAACGDDGADVESGSGAGGDEAGEGDDGEAGGGDAVPVLLVEVGGGFLPVEVSYQGLPNQVVYADGTVIEPAPQILIYPGPALPALNTYTVTSDALVAIEDAARDAGLDQPDLDYGEPSVADAGTTQVSVTVDGTTYVHTAYALGIEDGMVDVGITEEQAANRAALVAFLAEVTNLADLAGPDAVGEAEPYVAERYRLWVRTAAEADAGVESDLDPTDPVAWTVEGVELAAAACIPVEGDAVADVTALLTDADSLTRFESGGEVWAVLARPVLPHEPTCPDAAS